MTAADRIAARVTRNLTVEEPCDVCDAPTVLADLVLGAGGSKRCRECSADLVAIAAARGPNRDRIIAFHRGRLAARVPACSCCGGTIDDGECLDCGCAV